MEESTAIKMIVSLTCGTPILITLILIVIGNFEAVYNEVKQVVKILYRRFKIKVLRIDE